MAKNNTDNSTVIFHRTQTNAKDALEIQEAFIEAYLKHLPMATVDYITGDYKKSKEMLDLITNKKTKLITIIQSPISRRERHLRYDLNNILDFYKARNEIDIYHMDADGRLYKEIKDIEEIF